MILAQRSLFFTMNLTLSLLSCIAVATGFPWLQLGHFRFKRLPKWQINSSLTLSRALRFDSSSDEAETNTCLSDREEVMMFHFNIKPCKIECAGLEGRSGNTSFSQTSAATHKLSYWRKKKRKCCSCVRQRFCFLALCADGDKQEINKTEERKSEVSAIVLMYLLILAVGHKPSSPSCTRMCLMSAHFFVFCVILTFVELSNRGPVFIGVNLLKLLHFCIW